MALISKIREKSGLTITIVAVGLAIFLVGDNLFSANSFLFGNKKQIVGVIDGKKVSLEDFTQEENAIKNNYIARTQRQPSEMEMESIREAAWSQIIFKSIFEKEFDKLGLRVTDKELEAMVQGDSLFIHPQVRSAFTDPQTNKFDRERLRQSFTEQAANWAIFEQELAKDRLKTKYENIIEQTTYITKAEAEREYVSQNTKANVKFVYVPFMSIADSTLKVTDDQLKAYLNEHKTQYKVDANINLEYVTISAAPSSEDTAVFAKDLRDLAKSFAVAENDSTFAVANTDVAGSYDFQTVDKIPSGVFEKTDLLLKGGVYGPFLEGNNYSIVKVADVKEDSTYFVRASHILFKPLGTSEPDKAEAKKRATEVLDQLKNGEDFAKMAQIHGSDGTKNTGGDLGWFGKGRMVKPFEQATFATNQKGLIPNLVETDFGYHIIKITQPKTNKSYKLATIARTIAPTDQTRQRFYNKANEIASTSKNAEDLRNNVKKDPSLTLSKADKLRLDARNINELTNTREIVKWAFNEAKIGEVSRVFEIADQDKFMIAVVTKKVEKDDISVDNLRDELTEKVRTKLKEEKIIAKLATSKSSIEDLAKQYGSEAVFQTLPDVSFTNYTLGNVGFNPAAVGKTFGLKEGQQTKPFADESGVFVIKVEQITPAAAIADYSQYKTQLLQSTKAKAKYATSEALKDIYKVEDSRAKIY